MRTTGTPVQRILALRCDADAVLHTIAPLGLAAAAAPCLVLDLDPTAPPYPSPSSLARMIGDGPRRSDLESGRAGVAVIGCGGATLADAEPVVQELVTRWSRVAVRLGGEGVPWPTVAVRLLVPELPVEAAGPAVYQSVLPAAKAPGPGVVLPPLGRAAVRSLLAGVIEPRRRWVRAWRPVWGLPWA